MEYSQMNLIRRLTIGDGKISYSQCGEDLIVDFVFNALGISKPSYLDIGAHHPTHLNNTYLFYQKGCKGVCIEPNPALFAKIQRIRKRDICLNVGVGISLEREADFFVMSSDTLSTFSRETAERYQSYGNQSIVKVIRIPLVPINDIIKEHFKDCPDFVSLDVESMELEVLKTFDFTSFRPAVFCIETLTYTEDKSERKIDEISALMHSKGYLTYADTYMNTIFVAKQAWLSRI
jgi:FkbM family methyltransferase